MNYPLRPETAPPARHRFTCEEFQRLADSGALGDFPDLELIEGDIYEMPSDGPVTISWNAAIAEWLYASLAGQPYRIIPDKTLRVTAHNAPKPDFWIYPRAMPIREVMAAQALLAIEVADTSLAIDRDLKAPIYAKGGLREYWIVDCAARRLLVHRLGPNAAYPPPTEHGPDAGVEAALIPGLVLRLGDLDVPE